jgi:hypothetical protein
VSVAAECERLFMATVPFMRAESDAHKRLIAARGQYNAARKALASRRREWVDFMMGHDHLSMCLGRARPAPEQPSDTASAGEEDGP